MGKDNNGNNDNGVIRIKVAYLSYILVIASNIIGLVVFFVWLRADIDHAVKNQEKIEQRVDKLERLAILTREEQLKTTAVADTIIALTKEIKDLRNRAEND